MKIIYTFLFLFFCSLLKSQILMQEVVVVAESKKFQNRQAIIGEIQSAASNSIISPFDIYHKKVKIDLGGNIRCCPSSITKVLVKPLPVKSPDIRLRCNSRSNQGGDPIYVVDGKILSNISNINTNDIEDITIIKPAEAQALFGIRGKYGAIVIRLEMKYDKITIRDFIDKAPIAKATISFVFPERKDTLRYIADDSGVVMSNSLAKLEGCEMIVSAVGYKTKSRTFIHKRQEAVFDLFLLRDVRTCDEVILASTICLRRVCGGCRFRGIRIYSDSVFLKEKQDALKIFPNPVKKGKSLSLKFNVPVVQNIVLKVFSTDGQLVISYPVTANKGVLSMSIDPRWASGTYFLHVYENSRIAASGKVVVQ